MNIPVIDDSTPDRHIFPLRFGRGLDLSLRTAEGYAGLANPFPQELLIPRSEWQARIEERVAQKAMLSDLCTQASLPCLNQEQTNYCWANAPTYCCEVVRVLQNEPLVLLSPASVGAPLTNYRNEGGWGKPALQYISDHGAVPQMAWPANAIDHRYHTAESDVVARYYRVTEWWDLNGPNVFDNLISCLLRFGPVAAGYSWWRHEVTIEDPVWQDGAIALRGRNSWGMTWGDRGYFILQGNRMVPDDAVAPRVMVAF